MSERSASCPYLGRPHRAAQHLLRAQTPPSSQASLHRVNRASSAPLLFSLDSVRLEGCPQAARTLSYPLRPPSPHFPPLVGPSSTHAALQSAYRPRSIHSPASATASKLRPSHPLQTFEPRHCMRRDRSHVSVQGRRPSRHRRRRRPPRQAPHRLPLSPLLVAHSHLSATSSGRGLQPARFVLIR